MSAVATHYENANPIWDVAVPASEALYAATHNGNFHGSEEARDELRRGMASTVSCIHDAISQTASRMTCAYLSGAERTIQKVLRALCRAFDTDALGEDDYIILYGLCGRLCLRIDEELEAMPADSRDTVVINNYASLYLAQD